MVGIAPRPHPVLSRELDRIADRRSRRVCLWPGRRGHLAACAIPLQTTTLIVAFGLVVQGLSVWRLRRALRFDRLWPFLVGGAVGVPIGTQLLRLADPQHIRIGGRHAAGPLQPLQLVRPRLAVPTAGGRAADGSIGFLGGVLGGTTGLGGILPTVWCTLRGWPKDEQRAVFQNRRRRDFRRDRVLAWRHGPQYRPSACVRSQAPGQQDGSPASAQVDGRMAQRLVGGGCETTVEEALIRGLVTA